MAGKPARGCAALLGAAFLGVATGALADTRVFVIANSPDGYGVDQCLADGADCGKAVASAYCRAQDYAEAVSFRRVEREGLTTAAALPSEATGLGKKRDAFVAIACAR